MSDRDLNINIRTTADTSGADQTTEAINKTREAAQEAGGSADAINQGRNMNKPWKTPIPNLTNTPTP